MTCAMEVIHLPGWRQSRMGMDEKQFRAGLEPQQSISGGRPEADKI